MKAKKAGKKARTGTGVNAPGVSPRTGWPYGTDWSSRPEPRWQGEVGRPW